MLIPTSPAKVAFPKVDGENVFATCIPELKVAQPPSDISKVRAVITEPLSLPWNKISLSWTEDVIAKLEDELPKFPISVPPSFIATNPPSASKIILPATSSVKFPEFLNISALTPKYKSPSIKLFPVPTVILPAKVALLPSKNKALFEPLLVCKYILALLLTT